MMHHRYQRRLSDYLEGVLSPEDCARLESHLQECQECTSELRALQRTVELLHDLPSPAPPSDLADSVIARLRDEPLPASGWSRVSSWLGAALSPAWLAPAAVAAGVMAVMLVGGLDRTGEPQGSQTVVAQRRTPPRALPIATPPGALQTVSLERGHVRSPVRVRQTRRAQPQPQGQRSAAVDSCLREGRSEADCARYNTWRLVGLGVDDSDLFVREVDQMSDRDRSLWLRRVADFARKSGSASLVQRQLYDKRGPRAATVVRQLEGATGR